MARGVMQLQRLFGPIPIIKGVGPAAEAVAEELARMTQAASASSSLPGTLLKHWYQSNVSIYQSFDVHVYEVKNIHHSQLDKNQQILILQVLPW